MSFIAGAFAATFNGNPLGAVQDGFNIEYTPLKQLIRGDSFGEMAQDAVHQGVDVFLEFELLNTDVTSDEVRMTDLLWPWNNTATDETNAFGDAGVVGQLDSVIAAPIILTAEATSPAGATVGVNTKYTFALCTLAEGFPMRILLSSKLRTYPLRFRVYPSAAGIFFLRDTPKA